MYTLITSDIFTALMLYSPYAIITGILVMPVICIILSRIYNISIKEVVIRFRKKLILSYILYIYCFIVVSITYLSREPGSRDGIDLRLFSTFSGIIANDRYPIENIILFIPFGFLLPFMWKRFILASKCIGAGFLFSMAIEVSQLLTKRGYFQTDDILTNVLGSIIGYITAYGLISIIKYLKD